MVSHQTRITTAFLLHAFIFASMLFKDVIGQQQIKQHLVEMVQQNRLSHALLFLGKEGSGALPLAVIFANYVILLPVAIAQEPLLFEEASTKNKNSKNNYTPISIDQIDEWLQKQPGYSKVTAMVHPDIHFSYPVIPKKSGDKPISTDYIAEWREFIQQYPYGNVYDWLQFIGAENKQGNITAAECADILHKLNLKSFESGYKIIILWMPEYLDKEGNKLLKIIEEPPADTLFILVAENENQVLPTIVSRCQLIKIPVLETTDIEIALLKKADLAAEQARQIASISEGNYREALQLIQHAEEDWQTLLREWLNAILKTGPVAQTKWVEEAAKLGRERQKQFLRYFNHLLEQAIRLKVIGENTSPGNLLIPAAEMDFALRLNKIADISQQQAIIVELDKATYYIERNANAKMLFHALTIKLYHIIADKSLILTN